MNPADTSGLFPNGDNKYIAARLTYRPGRVAVVRGKAPSFPDTRAGVSAIVPDRQVRYWSMCQNDLVSPYPVVACAADFQTRLDDDGWYTFVVGAPQDLPAVGPAVTVLPWGSTDVAKRVLILRNMLPSSGFYPLSVQASQADGTDPAVSMGPYYPTIAYCSAAVFVERGPDGCLADPQS
ncbi:Lipoprotein [Prescottella defluvii]